MTVTFQFQREQWDSINLALTITINFDEATEKKNCILKFPTRR